LSFLLLLERLSAEERAAFLLNEVFDYSHAEAAAMLGITEETCRQRVHRARQRVASGSPRFTSDATNAATLLERFAAALEQPTEENLHALLAADAVHVADGGGAVTARCVLCMVRAYRRLYLQIALSEQAIRSSVTLQVLNGAPALLTWADGKLVTVMWIECNDEQIVSLQSSATRPNWLDWKLSRNRKLARPCIERPKGRPSHEDSPCQPVFPISTIPKP
jgi:hypothetical protein